MTSKLKKEKVGGVGLSLEDSCLNVLAAREDVNGALCIEAMR